MSSEGKTAKVLDELLSLCRQYDVLKIDDFEQDEIAHLELAETGLVDSLGIVFIKEILKRKYGVEIPTELFYAELKSLNSVASYLSAQV